MNLPTSDEQIRSRLRQLVKEEKLKGEFLFTLIDELLFILGDAYPELKEKKSHIQKVIKEEEVSFLRTFNLL